MKTVEVRHGCLDAVKCGALDHHECGATDACDTVKSTGFVCTFGTTTRVTFHEQSDIDAEVDERTRAHAAVFPDDIASNVNGKITLKAGSQAAIRQAAVHGKNIWSQAAEDEHRAHGHAHGAQNRALHDSSPAVFGH